MRLTCKVCSQDACDCNGQRCWCWLNVFQLYELQNWEDKPHIQVYDEYISEQSQTWKKCQFDWAWVWSKCIHCGQYKYYAWNWYQCQRPE